jgi:hypothetical protein
MESQVEELYEDQGKSRCRVPFFMSAIQGGTIICSRYLETTALLALLRHEAERKVDTCTTAHLHTYHAETTCATQPPSLMTTSDNCTEHPAAAPPQACEPWPA